MADEANIVGSAKVLIEVDDSLLAEQMQKAVETALASIKAEIPITARGAAGKAAAAGVAGTVEASVPQKGSKTGIDANVSSVTGISDAIKKALQSEGKGFALPIDQTGLRDQIQNALNQPFKIKLEIDGQIPVTVAAAPGGGGGGGFAASVAQRQQTLEPTAAFNRAIQSNEALQAKILNTYQGIQAVFAKQGKTFGAFDGNSQGDVFGKFTEMVREFGQVNGWIVSNKTEGGKTQLSGSLISSLKDAGVPVDDFKRGSALRNQVDDLRGSGGQGGSATISDLAQEIAKAINSQPTIVAAPKPAEVQHVASVAAAAAPVMANSVKPLESTTKPTVEAPSVATVAPETRDRARSIARFGLDDLVKETQLRINELPKGVPNKGSGAFDIDPMTNEKLTGEQVIDRSQGQLPTPVSPTGKFSYSQIVRAAQLGVFNYVAALVNDQNKPTGEFIKYDPTDTDNPETKKLLKGGRGAGSIAHTSEGRAIGLKPAETIEILARAADARPGAGIVPHEDLQAAPGGSEDEAFALRVFSKIIPAAARAFDRTIQAVKQNQPLGKRSGLFTGTEHSLQQLVQADEDYIKAWRQLEIAQSQLTDEGSTGSRQRKELESRVNKARSLMDEAIKSGADPGAIVAANLSTPQRLAQLRERRASEIEQNKANQENITNRVGISDSVLGEERRAAANQKRDLTIADPTLQKLLKLGTDIREGRVQVNRENLPEGYGLADDQPVTRSSFLRQHVTKILDDFRTQIGSEKGYGTADVPSEFGFILGPAKNALYNDIAREAGPGQPALRASTDRATARSLTSPSFAEQDRVRAEAAEHRGTNLMPVGTQMSGDRARLDRAKAALPAVTALDQRRLEEQRFLTGTHDATTVDPWLVEARAQQKSLRDADEQAAVAEYYKGSRSRTYTGTDGTRQRTGGVLVPKDEFVAQGVSFDQFKKDRAQTPGITEANAIDRRIEERAAEARANIQHIEQLKKHAETLIYHASGQLPIEGPDLTGEPLNMRSSPQRTGAETLEHLKGMNPEEIKKVLGMQGADFSDGMMALIDAQEQIQRGVAPGLTPDDVRRRSGSSQIAGLSGDRTRDITSKTAFVAGLETPPMSPEYAGGIGGTGLPPGGPTGGGTGGGGKKWDGFGSGPIHVLIDGQPVLVRLADGGGGSAQGSDLRRFASTTSKVNFSRARQQIFDTREAESGEAGVAEGQVGMFEDTRGKRGAGRARALFDNLKSQGADDETIRRFMRSTGFGGAAELLIGGGKKADAATTTQRDVTAGLAVIRRQLGLEPLRRNISSDNQDQADRLKARLGAEAEAADRKILSRGFQASLTDLLQSPFFEQQRQNVDRFRNESNQLASLAKERATIADTFGSARDTRIAARDRVSELRANNAKPEEVSSAEAIAKQTDRLFKDAGIRLRAVRGDERAQGARVDEARQGLPDRSDVVRNVAVGALASSGAVALGSIVFQLTSQALQLAEQAIGDALQKAADQMTGFANTASRVGSELADATRAAGGNVGAAVGTAAAVSGLSSVQFASISPLLEQRARVEAGNKNLVDQADLIRTAKNFQTNDAGFLQPGGGIPGLTRSTGGLFGSDIGATPDTATLLTRQLPGEDTNGFIGNLLPISSQFLGEAEQGLLGRDTLKNQLLSGGQSNDTPDPTILKNFETTIAGWNEDLSKSSSSLRLFTNATKDQADVLGQALKKAGADPDVIQRWQNLGLGVSDATGAKLNSEADAARVGGIDKLGAQLLNDLNEGSSKPNSSLILAANTNAFNAQIGAIRANADLERQSQAASFGLQGIGTPPLSLAEQTVGSTPNEAALGVFDNLKSKYGPVFDDLNTQIDLGVRALSNFGVSDEQIAKIQDYGKQIHDISVSMTRTQLDQETRDYNRGLDLAKRNLSDLVGLNGQLSTSVKGVGNVEASNLGVLENKVLMESRELTVLQQNLAYKQLEFRIAQAGFGAQGLTGEERAARRKQAEYEAEKQKEILDKQVSISKTQNKIVDEQNLRALHDALYDIQKYVHDYQVRIELRGEAAVLTALTALKDKAVGEAQVTMGEFKAMEQLAISTAASIVKDTGEAFNEVLSKARTTLSQLAADVKTALDTATGVTTNPDGSRVKGGSYGTSTTPGSPTVNPSTGFTTGKATSDTGGPGGLTPSRTASPTSHVNISFGDVTVRSTADIDEIARKVERALNTQAALYGLRAPIGS